MLLHDLRMFALRKQRNAQTCVLARAGASQVSRDPDRLHMGLYIHTCCLISDLGGVGVETERFA